MKVILDRTLPLGDFGPICDKEASRGIGLRSHTIRSVMGRRQLKGSEVQDAGVDLTSLFISKSFADTSQE